MKRLISHEGERHELELEPGEERVVVRDEGRELAFEVLGREGKDWLLRVDGQLVRGSVKLDRERAEIAWEGRRLVVDLVQEGDEGEVEAGLGPIEAPMTGRVVSVAVEEGAVVEAGTAIVLVEAMKMEHKLTAPQPCRIAEICCAAGEQVEIGQLLVRLEEIEEAS